jgi:hypothetical protein
MTKRTPVAVLLLPLVTLSIYWLYWLVQTKTEMNSSGADIPTAWLLVIPFAGFWWEWKFGEGVDRVTHGRMSAGVAFLLLFFLGNIGAMIIQSELNKVAT